MDIHATKWPECAECTQQSPRGCPASFARGRAPCISAAGSTEEGLTRGATHRRDGDLLNVPRSLRNRTVLSSSGGGHADSGDREGARRQLLRRVRGSRRDQNRLRSTAPKDVAHRRALPRRWGLRRKRRHEQRSELSFSSVVAKQANLIFWC
jgi:hypothetical protein